MPRLLLPKPPPSPRLVHRTVSQFPDTDHSRAPPRRTTHGGDGEPPQRGVHSKDQLRKLPQRQTLHRNPRRLSRVRHIQRGRRAVARPAQVSEPRVQHALPQGLHREDTSRGGSTKACSIT